MASRKLILFTCFLKIKFVYFDRIYKLTPVSTNLPISKRFAVIQQNSPLGSISYHNFANLNANSGSGLYNHDAFAQNRQPSVAVGRGSKQNQEIFKTLQTANGNALEPAPTRTVRSNRSTYLPSSSTNISISQRYQSASGPSRREEESNFIAGVRERNRVRETVPVRAEPSRSPRRVEAPRRQADPVGASRSTRRGASPPARRNPPPRKPEKKPISERLGRISVFNRLGTATTSPKTESSTSKPPIHHRLDFNTNTKKSIQERLSSPRKVPVVESTRFKARNRPSRQTSRAGSSRSGSSSKKSSTLRRQLSIEDLNNEMDTYMATD